MLRQYFLKEKSIETPSKCSVCESICPIKLSKNSRTYTFREEETLATAQYMRGYMAKFGQVGVISPLLGYLSIPVGAYSTDPPGAGLA